MSNSNSNPITWTLGAIGSTICFVTSTVVSGVCLAGVTGAALYVTKPDEKSFDDFLKKEIRKEIPGPGIVGRTVGNAANKISDKIIDDVIICRIATVKLGPIKRKYVGILGTWFDVTSKYQKFHGSTNGTDTNILT
jgi:hypothetical protein